MKVYPTDDPTRVIVIDPATGQTLPEDGKEVSSNDLYWLHMLKLGDATLEMPQSVKDRLAAEKAAAEKAAAAATPAPVAASGATPAPASSATKS